MLYIYICIYIYIQACHSRAKHSSECNCVFSCVLSSVFPSLVLLTIHVAKCTQKMPLKVKHDHYVQYSHT